MLRKQADRAVETDVWVNESPDPTLRSAALLVFLAAAAGTRIVAPDFVATNDLLHRAGFACAGHARLLELAALAALEGLFHVVHRGRRAAARRTRTERPYLFAAEVATSADS